MTLFLDEGAVGKLVTMDDALAAVDAGFTARARGVVDNLPRAILHHSGGTVRITAALIEDQGYFGVKVSSSAVFGSGAGRLLSLYAIATGRLCAVLQVFGLGALRTAAVSGVATRLLARPDADVLGLVGTGRQARTQLEAMRRVRPIHTVRMVGRDPVRRATFAEETRGEGLEVEECGTVQEAVAGAMVVVTATTATEPILSGDWLSAGAHVNAIGSNDPSRRELDSAVVARAELIVADEPAQARYEAADLIHPVAEGLIGWEEVRGLDEVLTGAVAGRRSAEGITLFESLGTAIGDVALAARAYEAALDRGIGQRLPDLSGEVS